VQIASKAHENSAESADLKTGAAGKSRALSRLPMALQLAQFLQPILLIDSSNQARDSGLILAPEEGWMQLVRENETQDNSSLSKRLEGRLRVIAKQSITVWFNRERLDRLLTQYISQLDDCELLYAIDENGRQVSSNIHVESIDVGAYGQDLSRRPYAVSLSVLNNVAAHGAFACGAYSSQVTHRPCVTVMYGVTSGTAVLGYIAADIHIENGQPDSAQQD